MTSTSHPEFNDTTEGLEVAKAFAGMVHGKTILVTGVNRRGIGFATVEAFASQSPYMLILTGGNSSNFQECIDALVAKYPDVLYRSLELELSSQESVRISAAEVLSWTDVPKIDIVINNAGVMFIPARTLNKDGIEMHLATNHIGHFFLTCLILPKLIEAAQGSPRGATRVVNISAGSPWVAKMRWSDLNFEQANKDLPEIERPDYDLHRLWGTTDVENAAYIPLEAYNQSKVANVLFGIAASKWLYDKYGILSLALHRGVMKTELDRRVAPEFIESAVARGLFSYRFLQAGAATTLVAALDPKLRVGETRGGDSAENYGAFLADCQISGSALPLAVSSDEAEKLWRLSEDLVKERFDW
ncbi:hypothetical protein BX600DRAFT_437095 [Xylariales sp. PMI_506]|nr:hypothetical protein BX600DRAFT_437095 [Xylariales sp. PMI_506]